MRRAQLLAKCEVPGQGQGGGGGACVWQTGGRVLGGCALSVILPCDEFSKMVVACQIFHLLFLLTPTTLERGFRASHHHQWGWPSRPNHQVDANASPDSPQRL